VDEDSRPGIDESLRDCIADSSSATDPGDERTAIDQIDGGRPS
jgi:hypothetical protein